MAYIATNGGATNGFNQTMPGNAGAPFQANGGGNKPKVFRQSMSNVPPVHSSGYNIQPPASYSAGMKRYANKSAPFQLYVYPEVKTTYLSPPPIEPIRPAPPTSASPTAVGTAPGNFAYGYPAPPNSYTAGVQYTQNYQQPVFQGQQQQPYGQVPLHQYAQSAPISYPLAPPPPPPGGLYHPPATTYASAEPSAPLYQSYGEVYSAVHSTSSPPPPHLIMQPPISSPAGGPQPMVPQLPPHRQNPSRTKSPNNNYQQQQQQQPPPLSWANGKNNKGAHDIYQQTQVAYHRNSERQRERSSFSILYHCLEPVNLLNKSSFGNTTRKRGNLDPLYKANEEWILPNVGLPLENRPGYRCIMYIVDGTLLLDNGLSGEKMLGKGTLHMSTTSHTISTYVRNPSKTHHVHLIRLWIDTERFASAEATAQPSPGGSSSDIMNDASSKISNAERKQQQQQQQQKGAVVGTNAVKYPDFSYTIRYTSDSDKRNCLLLVAQPRDYHPSFGMTSLIYGGDGDGSKSSGHVSPIGSSYYLSQSMVFTRPDYFSPVPFENLSMSTSNGLANNEWMLTDPALNLRACADPLLVGEDFFFSMCSLDSMCTVVYEPLDAHDKHRNTAQQQQKIKARGGRRRIWLQTILNDVSPDVVASNGGRLVVNGDKINRLRPGDSAYVRKLAPSETLTLYNCGRNPIEFIIAETPY